MAGDFSSTGALIALDYISGRAVPFTAPRTTYLALLTNLIDDSYTPATMPEVADASYARAAVTWTPASTPVSGPSLTQNSGLITFGPFSAGMALPTVAAALVSSSSGLAGDLVFWWQLDFSLQAATNEAVQFAINALTMALT